MDASNSLALMPTGTSTGSGAFTANVTTPEVYATTGFVTGYPWGSLDNATWCAFLVYQLYYSFVILNEAALNYKLTFIWALVFSALAFNIMSAITGLYLIDCFIFNTTPDPHVCDYRMHIYYPIECMCFCLGFWLLFYRKYKVVPEKLGYPGALDVVVLMACCCLNLAADIPCLYSDITTCFLQDVYQASAGALSFLYFDVWFLVCVSRKTFEKGSKWEVLQLTALTGSVTFIYLVGSISYKTWGGNFYTNTIWNMGYCILPLYCIESVVSPKFLKMFAKDKSSKRASHTTSHEDPSTLSRRKSGPVSLVRQPSGPKGAAGSTLTRHGKQLDSTAGGAESAVDRAVTAPLINK
ncbi:hypothetical protein HDU81_010245 [Chytriomyces hyalinus]|nr:hypothetical protein HDU81_010245 [Chytriomyces hyalinus]